MVYWALIRLSLLAIAALMLPIIPLGRKMIMISNETPKMIWLSPRKDDPMLMRIYSSSDTMMVLPTNGPNTVNMPPRMALKHTDSDTLTPAMVSGET